VMVLVGFIACKKEQTFLSGIFPGFTGAGDEATWVVSNNNITDVSYVTGVLAKLTPPQTVAKYDSTFKLARQKEVSPYSIKLKKGGEIFMIGKSAENTNIWIKQQDLKWEVQDEILYASKNVNGSWVNIFAGYKDENKLLVRYKKSYFGDTSTDKERFVMEVQYTMFK